MIWSFCIPWLQWPQYKQRQCKHKLQQPFDELKLFCDKLFYRLKIVNQSYCRLCSIGCRQKIKKIPRALFGTDSTQGSIWRHFFWSRVSSSHTPRAFYAAPLAAPSWTSLFGLFLLPRQKYNLELEFLADFHIFCTKFCPDRSELLRSEIHWVYKKLWPFNWTPFPCLWGAFPRTDPFHLFA